MQRLLYLYLPLLEILVQKVEWMTFRSSLIEFRIFSSERSETIEVVLRVLEIAVYSERKVDRKDYEKMYRDIRILYAFLSEQEKS